MDVDLRAYLRVLSKRKWLIILPTLAGLVAGAFITARSQSVYEAQTTLFVGERQVSLESAAEGLVVRNFSIGLLKSYVEIVKSRSIAQKAVVEGGLDTSPGAIQGGLRAEALLETQIIRVSYRDTDPVRAQQVTNAVADAFVNDIGRLSTDEQGEPAIEVSVIDRAIVPGRPLGPNIPRNMTLAGLLGLLLGAGLAYIVERLDVTIKDRDEVEALGVPVLGLIPRLDTQGAQVYLERDTQGIAGEAFRKLRTAVGFIDVHHSTKSLLVTSPTAEEGKTTTSLNLAMAYALSGLRTVLVEADLRRPTLHRIFGMIGTRGLTTAIVGDVPLSEAIMSTETRNLSVIVAGAIPPNPVELLGSDQMTELLERLERMFDIVIVDSPPIVPVADPAALASRCDGVILVTRSGKTDKRRLLDAVTVIERAGGRMLGVVLNFLKPSDAPYDYAYYYDDRAGPRVERTTGTARVPTGDASGQRGTA